MDDLWLIAAMLSLGLRAGCFLRDQQPPRWHRKLGRPLLEMALAPSMCQAVYWTAKPIF